MIAYLKEGGERAWLGSRSQADARFACEHGCAESHVSQSTNESVSSRMISLMVAGSADRVQSTPANTVAKHVMSSLGSSTINERNKQCCKWSKRFLSFGRQLDGE
jgi:hypothetical protein